MAIEVTIGQREYFPNIGRIPFEGPDSDNPLAFRYYQPEVKVANKTMAEHLRVAVAYWHAFCGLGGDPFGVGTRRLAWLESSDPMQQASDKLDAAFEFITKLGVSWYCFHDRDLAPAGTDLAESAERLAAMVELAKAKQSQSGVRLLWGTANLFSHPRYMDGAATNPDFSVVAHAAAQVKAAIDATIALGGENYVFWGGREGYSSLLNVNMKRELDHLAIFLRAARDYGRANGFQGTFLIEPKPMEPLKHQYDYDVSTVIGFLQRHDLASDFRVNIENNHATLSGHSFAHEVQAAADAGLLGSLDINQGDPHNGWDTDEFMTNLYDTTHLMLVLLQCGGLGRGGMNFDAKLRRSSIAVEDLFIGHIASMDALARGLLNADRILRETDYLERRTQRYKSFDADQGAAFERGELDFQHLAKLGHELGEPTPKSGQQEYFESLVNWAIR